MEVVYIIHMCGVEPSGLYKEVSLYRGSIFRGFTVFISCSLFFPLSARSLNWFETSAGG